MLVFAVVRGCFFKPAPAVEGRRTHTFPEDWMPLMTAMQTKIQATSRDRVIFQFSPPVSSMELVMLRVWRYQK